MNKIKKLTVHNLKEQPDDWDGDDFEVGWYIRDPNNPDCLYVGPYGTRNELDESKDKKGLETFWKYLC